MGNKQVEKPKNKLNKTILYFSVVLCALIVYLFGVFDGQNADRVLILIMYVGVFLLYIELSQKLKNKLGVDDIVFGLMLVCLWYFILIFTDWFEINWVKFLSVSILLLGLYVIIQGLEKLVILFINSNDEEMDKKTKKAVWLVLKILAIVYVLLKIYKLIIH
jgi:hypothetical protein